MHGAGNEPSRRVGLDPQEHHSGDRPGSAVGRGPCEGLHCGEFGSSEVRNAQYERISWGSCIPRSNRDSDQRSVSVHGRVHVHACIQANKWRGRNLCPRVGRQLHVHTGCRRRLLSERQGRISRVRTWRSQLSPSCGTACNAWSTCPRYRVARRTYRRCRHCTYDLTHRPLTRLVTPRVSGNWRRGPYVYSSRSALAFSVRPGLERFPLSDSGARLRAGSAVDDLDTFPLGHVACGAPLLHGRDRGGDRMLVTHSLGHEVERDALDVVRKATVAFDVQTQFELGETSNRPGMSITSPKHGPGAGTFITARKGYEPNGP